MNKKEKVKILSHRGGSCGRENCSFVGMTGTIDEVVSDKMIWVKLNKGLRQRIHCYKEDLAYE